ncbi:Cyclic AMP-responsive element-binding protein 3-like protein 4 [Taenia crassiceps]|uniref:Cyclic AMP-responsive element-binding protein 3-like protein 4 n=1 Tax=Taenia crassiceps TaxID=6207 RepID=A0ABR4Q1J6_9CEST
MDYEVSSAAVLVPRIGEQLSQSLSSLKDRFTLDDYANAEQPLISPLFQSIQEGCPTDIITFHHQEEVVATTDSQDCSLPPLGDLDSIDTNDLFSFILDDVHNSDSSTLVDGMTQDTLRSVFDAPFDAAPHPTLPSDLDIPLDLLDLIDSSLSDSPRQKSDSSSSSNPPFRRKMIIDDSSSDYSEADNDHYGSGDEEFIERAMPSRGRGRSCNRSSLSICLHNEDLARGKPGQRLVLTAEEKRLLVQMGQRVPTVFPLTRCEERAIRTMRRKIRNKLSAKASRVRRQEYLSRLESRVADCHKENQRLRSRVTELERDKRGLLANLRQMRSYVARLIASTCSTTNSGCGLKSDSATPPLQPLLPLTVPRKNQQQQQQRLTMKSGKPASLLLVALMILASATILPLPDLDAPTLKDVSAADQGVLSGRSRVLLNQETVGDYTSEPKSQNFPTPPPSIVGSRTDPGDDGLGIGTKVRILNKSVDRMIVQSIKAEEDQFDPFLLPTSVGMKEGLASNVKKGPDISYQQVCLEIKGVVM